jgi:hypothetical protein
MPTRTRTTTTTTRTTTKQSLEPVELRSRLKINDISNLWKKYDQTDSRAPKCLPRFTKTVMYIVNITRPI